MQRIVRKIPAWIVYLIGLVPAVLLFRAAIYNQLGPDPLATLENELGEWALKFLIAVLLITPLLRFARLNLIKFRRPLGLLAFSYVVLHFTVYLWLDRQWDWWTIWEDILKRPYITIGTAAFLLMLPLAITSNNASVKKMGTTAWRNLHRLAYPAAIFGAVHYVLLEKTWEPEALTYLAILLTLVSLRIVWRSKEKGR